MRYCELFSDILQDFRCVNQSRLSYNGAGFNLQFYDIYYNDIYINIS